MRLVSKGNVICWGGGQGSRLSALPLFEHGCGLPSVSGSQTWSLGLGDSGFGSVLSSLLSKCNFSLSDLRESKIHDFHHTGNSNISHSMFSLELHR